MKKAKVLVADDDVHVRNALRTRLSSWGYRVVESADGLGVIDQALRADADVLVLDHDMPNGTGREVARMIRKECDVPIVFISGHDREQFRSLVYAMPNVYFLSKPLDQEKLKELLASLLPAGSGVPAP